MVPHNSLYSTGPSTRLYNGASNSSRRVLVSVPSSPSKIKTSRFSRRPPIPVRCARERAMMSTVYHRSSVRRADARQLPGSSSQAGSSNSHSYVSSSSAGHGTGGAAPDCAPVSVGSSSSSLRPFPASEPSDYCEPTLSVNTSTAQHQRLAVFLSQDLWKRTQTSATPSTAPPASPSSSAST